MADPIEEEQMLRPGQIAPGSPARSEASTVYNLGGLAGLAQKYVPQKKAARVGPTNGSGPGFTWTKVPRAAEKIGKLKYTLNKKQYLTNEVTAERLTEVMSKIASTDVIGAYGGDIDVGKAAGRLFKAINAPTRLKMSVDDPGAFFQHIVRKGNLLTGTMQQLFELGMNSRGSELYNAIAEPLRNDKGVTAGMVVGVMADGKVLLPIANKSKVGLSVIGWKSFLKPFNFPLRVKRIIRAAFKALGAQAFLSAKNRGKIHGKLGKSGVVMKGTTSALRNLDKWGKTARVQIVQNELKAAINSKTEKSADAQKKRIAEQIRGDENYWVRMGAGYQT